MILLLDKPFVFVSQMSILDLNIQNEKWEFKKFPHKEEIFGLVGRQEGTIL